MRFLVLAMAEKTRDQPIEVVANWRWLTPSSMGKAFLRQSHK